MAGQITSLVPAFPVMNTTNRGAILSPHESYAIATVPSRMKDTSIIDGLLKPILVKI